jgi:hypothetical protein
VDEEGVFAFPVSRKIEEFLNVRSGRGAFTRRNIDDVVDSEAKVTLDGKTVRRLDHVLGR